ncbi:MAG: hypothetical protein AAGH57_07215 [Pseudomonadota bacterium]
MTEHTPQPKLQAKPGDARDELRAKIDAQERRMAERTLADEAREAASAASHYAKEHPLQVVGGAIALGLALGLLTKPGRRAAGRAASGTANAVGGAASGAVKGVGKGVGKAAKKRGSAIAGLLADALVAYAIKLIDEALESSRAGPADGADTNGGSMAKDNAASRSTDTANGSSAGEIQARRNQARNRATRAVRNLADRVTG